MLWPPVWESASTTSRPPPEVIGLGITPPVPELHGSRQLSLAQRWKQVHKDHLVPRQSLAIATSSSDWPPFWFLVSFLAEEDAPVLLGPLFHALPFTFTVDPVANNTAFYLLSLWGANFSALPLALESCSPWECWALNSCWANWLPFSPFLDFESWAEWSKDKATSINL